MYYLKFVRCCLTFLMIMCSVSQVQAGGMLVNLGPLAEWNDVKSYAQDIVDNGDVDLLGIHSAGTPGQRNFDDQTIIVSFFCNSDSLKLAAFSDDGINLDITDQTTGQVSHGVLANKGIGQALPNLNQSLKQVDYNFQSNHVYELKMEYLNTFYTGDGDIDGALLIAYAGTINNAFQLEFDNIDVMAFDYPTQGSNSSGNISDGGTNPRNNTIVSPGQIIVFQVIFKDSDRYRVGPPWGNWSKMTGNGVISKYEVKVTVENAKLDENSAGQTGPNGFSQLQPSWVTNATFLLDKDHLISFPTSVNGYTGRVAEIKIKINDNWDGTNPVKVKVNVSDKSTVDTTVFGNQFQFKSGETISDIQDTDINLDMQWNKSQNGTVYPTSDQGIKQTYIGSDGKTKVSNMVGTEELTDSVIIWYKYLADLNGVNMAPNYEGITVTEYFRDVSSNIEYEWLKDFVKKDFEGKTSEQIVSELAFLTFSTATFVISNKDETSDYYGFTVSKTFYELYLNQNSVGQQDIEILVKQDYKCFEPSTSTPDGRLLSTQTLSSKYALVDGVRVTKIKISAN